MRKHLISLLTAIVTGAAATAAPFEHFIVRAGAQLRDGDRSFRFIGVNMPEATSVRTDWDLRQARRFRLPERVELDWIAESAAQANFKVVRTWMFPDTRTDGWPEDLSYFWPNTDGVTVRLNEDAFRRFDYLLQRCNDVGVRLQVPFVYLYFGRTPLWQTDASLPHPQMLDLVRQVILRRNTLTGVLYRDDKAIYAWESANEPKPPPQWVAALAAHVKALDQNHLFVDGRWSAQDVFDSYCLPGSTLLHDPNIDLVSVHSYDGPLKSKGWDWDRTLGEIARGVSSGNKLLDLGEIAPDIGGRELSELLEATLKHGLVSAMFWSSKGASAKGGYVHWAGRGYDDIAWPGFVDPELPGVSGEKEERVDLLVDAAYRIEGKTRPATLPPPRPATLLPASDAGHVTWVPGAGEQTADIERADSDEGAFEVIARDFPTHRISTYAAFNDRSAELGRSYFYRVRSKNSGGQAELSHVVGPVAINHRWCVDDFWDLSLTQSHSAAVQVEKHYRLTPYHDDLAVLKATADQQEIVYRVDGAVNHVALISNSDTQSVTLHGSSDGREFSRFDVHRHVYPALHRAYQAQPRVLRESADLTAAGYRYVKIVFDRADVLTRLEIAYGGERAPASRYAPETKP